MFDIGFWEITLICVVALLVVGPERFPGLVRGAGYWLGRFRQMASNMKAEFQAELDKAEQLKRLMEEQEEIMQRHILPPDEILGDEDDEAARKPRPVAATGNPSRPVAGERTAGEHDSKDVDRERKA